MLKDAKIYSKVVNDIENVVYIELRMRGYKVDVGVVPISEKEANGILTMNIYDFLLDAKSLEK